MIVTPIGVNIADYPAIFAHLSKWQPQLEKRWDKGKHWWELRACDYYDKFSMPKIVFPDIAKVPRFACEVAGRYTNDTTFFITVSEPYLLGVVNSASVHQYFIEIGATVRGGYLRFKPLYVENIPIPNASAADRNAIADLVQRCLDVRGVGCGEWETEIDARVAALYGVGGRP